jgi:hypothetical protein
VLSITPNKPIQWTQPSARRPLHELRSEAGLLATLEFTGRHASGISARGNWRIERDVTRTIRVWNAVSGDLHGELSKGGWTGRRVFATTSGRIYVWEPANLWRTAWRFKADSGAALEFRRGRGVLRASGSVFVPDSAGSDSDMDLLAILARYLVLLDDNDNGVAAAAAVVGSMPPPV